MHRYTPIYVKNLAGLLACTARRLLAERREATATTTAATTTTTATTAATPAAVMRPPSHNPPRQTQLEGDVLEAGDGDGREIGGAVLEAGDAHVSAAQLRALVLSCRAAPPPPPWAWAPARLPYATQASNPQTSRPQTSRPQISLLLTHLSLALG